MYYMTYITCAILKVIYVLVEPLPEEHGGWEFSLCNFQDLKGTRFLKLSKSKQIWIQTRQFL